MLEQSLYLVTKFVPCVNSGVGVDTLNKVCSLC